MGQIRRMALAAMVLATVTSGAFGADSKPAEPAKTTSTTDRLKAKKKAPAASLERKVAETPAIKPAAKARPAGEIRKLSQILQGDLAAPGTLR